MPQGRAACGGQSQTACIARRNLSLRQPVVAGGRRGTPRCQGEAGVRQPLGWSQVSANGCVPHARVRQPFLVLEPTQGPGAATRGRPGTPALAAGLTAQVWTRRDVRRLRVPPGPQPQAL
jgi:hypothetical protein